MSESEIRQFDDPALKAAVKRACGHERAPLDLANRCRAAMRQAVPVEAPAATSDAVWRMPRWTGYAAAAVVLLVVGISLFVARDNDSSTNAPTGWAASVLPASYLSGLVQRHDTCRDQYSGKHYGLDCDPNDFNQIDRELERQMKGEVLVMDLRQDGWRFHGAAMCPLQVREPGATESLPASHLLFDKDGHKTISIISVPFQRTCGAKPGQTFVDDAGENHLVVGFVDENELHCLVGHSPDGSLTREQLLQIGQKYNMDRQVARLPHTLLIARIAYLR